MALHDKSGRKLWRRIVLQHRYLLTSTEYRVEVLIILPSGRRARRVWKAPPHQGFREGGIDQILENVNAELEQRFPEMEFRLAQRGSNAFTIAYVGLKGAENEARSNPSRSDAPRPAPSAVGG